jgi:hypothetical protein
MSGFPQRPELTSRTANGPAILSGHYCLHCSKQLGMTPDLRSVFGRGVAKCGRCTKLHKLAAPQNMVHGAKLLAAADTYVNAHGQSSTVASCASISLLVVQQRDLTIRAQAALRIANRLSRDHVPKTPLEASLVVMESMAAWRP